MVQVIKHGIQQALLTDGQSFGETVLYSTTTKRNATIITRSYCQVCAHPVCVCMCDIQVIFPARAVYYYRHNLTMIAPSPPCLKLVIYKRVPLSSQWRELNFSFF